MDYVADNQCKNKIPHDVLSFMLSFHHLADDSKIMSLITQKISAAFFFAVLEVLKISHGGEGEGTAEKSKKKINAKHSDAH